MPRPLHEQMVEACKLELKPPFATSQDMERLTSKLKLRKMPRPDLATGELAIECMCPTPQQLRSLRRYRDSWNKVILVLPTPGYINEVWLFNMERNGIYRKLLV